MKTETLESMKKRRAVRSFTDTQVSESDLNAVLEAGTYAPTGMNTQSPKIIVLQNKEDIEQLAKINAAIMGRDIDPFYGAPTVLIVMADSTQMTHQQDGCLVMANLMLAAYAVGLGSCWIHRAKEEFETSEGKALLKKWGIDEKYVGIAHCILGYPAEALPEAKPRKSDYIVRV